MEWRKLIPDNLRDAWRVRTLNRLIEKDQRWFDERIRQVSEENRNEDAEALRSERDMTIRLYREELLVIDSRRLLKRARKRHVFVDDLMALPSLNFLGQNPANYWSEGEFGLFLEHRARPEFERLLQKAEADHRKARRESITSWSGLLFGVLGILLSAFAVWNANRPDELKRTLVETQYRQEHRLDELEAHMSNLEHAVQSKLEAPPNATTPRTAAKKRVRNRKRS